MEIPDTKINVRCAVWDLNILTPNIPDIRGAWRRAQWHMNRDGNRWVKMDEDNIRHDGLAAIITQQKNTIASTPDSMETPGYFHRLHGSFVNDKECHYVIQRTDKLSQRVTVIMGVLTVLDEDTFQTVHVGTDGADDLPQNFREVSVWRRTNPMLQPT